LSLPFPAQREDTLIRGLLGQYIIRNIDDWFEFAQHLGSGIENIEEIILVTGRHRTRSWVAATFYESQMGSLVSFGVQASGVSHVDLKWMDARGGTLKLGPSGDVRFCII
jgi:hypothetical protein